MTVTVRNQTELDAALRDHPNELIECVGNGEFSAYGSATVRASGSATVHAYGWATVHASDSATVHASGSATVRAYGSATVRAYGSATVRAYGSATVHASDSATVHASDSATVHASDSATVHASGSVAIHVVGNTPTVEGGVQITLPATFGAEDWCGYHGLPVVDGTVVLFKALTDEFKSSRGFVYTPGESVEAKDWKPTAACGNGLHFVARPWEGHKYLADATRYVGCPVLVADIVVIDSGKVKAPRCGPVFEVDEDGERIAVAEVSA